ncbi:MAG: DNA-processing protein DprA [Sandaracinaceae bacterium]
MKPRPRLLDAAEHPASLAALSKPPAKLWAVGSLPAGPSVAVVGTRRANPEALRFTEGLAEELARAGVGVVSGGADGVDAAAHRGALRGEGATWVVQAAGLDAPYPSRSRRLFDEIVEAGGGWLSETPPGQPPYKSRFLERNRIIAALADLVLVVQAPARSGSLSTARHAVSLGRPLYAVPASPWDLRAQGTTRLLAKGAASPCLSAADLLEALGRDAPQAALPLPPPPLTGALGVVYDALESTPRHLDVLAAATGLSAPEVQVALVRLAAKGLARPEGAGWCMRG